MRIRKIINFGPTPRIVDEYLIELVYSYRDRGAINIKDKKIDILEVNKILYLIRYFEVYD